LCAFGWASFESSPILAYGSHFNPLIDTPDAQDQLKVADKVLLVPELGARAGELDFQSRKTGEYDPMRRFMEEMDDRQEEADHAWGPPHQIMRNDRYHPAQIDEVEDRPSFINTPLPPDNVGVLVPSQQRSLRAVIAQNLKDVEGLINRLDAGVAAADSGRVLIRELYVRCRKQREVLSAVLRLELE
jgi:hypothetical protein